MPSLGIARTMEVASTYIPCRRMVRHRFQASFRRVRVFTERRLDFKQSSLCHITRVPSRTPSMPSQGRDFPGMLLSRPPFDFGLAIRPRNDPPSSSQLRWGYDRAPPRRTIYTRLTATGRHELRVACTCTATSARARAVNATRPSIPAAARPALRCVTCRTLTSVSDQFRSMSFCRFRAFARSPSRTALKILRRSRRTRSSCSRQSTCCQASPSNTPGGSSGPFTEVSNVPFGSDIHVRFVVKGSPAHVSTHPRFQAPGPVSGRLSNHHPGEGPGHAVVGFPLSFDHRHSLLGHPVPPGIPPRSLSAYQHRTRLPAHPVWTQTRVYHVPHA